MKVNMNLTPDEESVVKNIEKPKKSKSKKSTSADVETTNEEKPNKPFKVKDLVRMNKFWIALCVIFFIMFLSVNSNTGNMKTYFTVKLRNITSDTESLQASIDELKTKLDEQAKIDSLALSDEERDAAYHSAEEQGKLVATLQNVYKKVNASDNPEEYNTNVNSLDACFDESSKESRVKWYEYDEFIPGTWEFVSKASFVSNNTGDINVLWLCYADNDHTLLAYCTASYHVSTKMFSNVVYKATKYAEAAANPNSNNNMSSVNSVIDSLKLMIENGSIESADEDKPDKKTIHTNNEISESRNSLKEAIKNGSVSDNKYDSRYDIGIQMPSNADKGGTINENAK